MDRPVVEEGGSQQRGDDQSIATDASYLSIDQISDEMSQSFRADRTMSGKRKRGSRRGYYGDLEDSSPSDDDELRSRCSTTSTAAGSLGKGDGDDNTSVLSATATEATAESAAEATGERIINFYACVRPRKRRRKQTVAVRNIGDVKLLSSEDYERQKNQSLRRAYPWFFNCTNDAKSSRVDPTTPSSSSSSSDGSSSSDTDNDNITLPKKCSGMSSRPFAVTDVFGSAYLLDSIYNLCEVPSSSTRRRFSLNLNK